MWLFTGILVDGSWSLVISGYAERVTRCLSRSARNAKLDTSAFHIPISEFKPQAQSIPSDLPPCHIECR